MILYNRAKFPLEKINLCKNKEKDRNLTDKEKYLEQAILHINNAFISDAFLKLPKSSKEWIEYCLLARENTKSANVQYDSITNLFRNVNSSKYLVKKFPTGAKIMLTLGYIKEFGERAFKLNKNLSTTRAFDILGFRQHLADIAHANPDSQITTLIDSILSEVNDLSYIQLHENSGIVTFGKDKTNYHNEFQLYNHPINSKSKDRLEFINNNNNLMEQSIGKTKDKLFADVIDYAIDFMQNKDITMKDWVIKCLKHKNNHNNECKSLTAISYNNSTSSFLQKGYTRGFHKALTIGYIINKGQSAFDKEGKLNIKDFVDSIKKSLTLEENQYYSTLLNNLDKNYLKNIRLNRLTNIITFGKLNYSSNTLDLTKINNESMLNDSLKNDDQLRNSSVQYKNSQSIQINNIIESTIKVPLLIVNNLQNRKKALSDLIQILDKNNGNDSDDNKMKAIKRTIEWCTQNELAKLTYEEILVKYKANSVNEFTNIEQNILLLSANKTTSQKYPRGFIQLVLAYGFSTGKSYPSVTSDLKWLNKVDERMLSQLLVSIKKYPSLNLENMMIFNGKYKTINISLQSENSVQDYHLPVTLSHQQSITIKNKENTFEEKAFQNSQLSKMFNGSTIIPNLTKQNILDNFSVLDNQSRYRLWFTLQLSNQFIEALFDNKNKPELNIKDMIRNLLLNDYSNISLEDKNLQEKIKQSLTLFIYLRGKSSIFRKLLQKASIGKPISYISTDYAWIIQRLEIKQLENGFMLIKYLTENYLLLGNGDVIAKNLINKYTVKLKQVNNDIIMAKEGCRNTLQLKIAQFKNVEHDIKQYENGLIEHTKNEKILIKGIVEANILSQLLDFATRNISTTSEIDVDNLKSAFTTYRNNFFQKNKITDVMLFNGAEYTEYVESFTFESCIKNKINAVSIDFVKLYTIISMKLHQIIYQHNLLLYNINGYRITLSIINEYIEENRLEEIDLKMLHTLNFLPNHDNSQFCLDVIKTAGSRLISYIGKQLKKIIPPGADLVLDPLIDWVGSKAVELLDGLELTDNNLGAAENDFKQWLLDNTDENQNKILEHKYQPNQQIQDITQNIQPMIYLLFEKIVYIFMEAVNYNSEVDASNTIIQKNFLEKSKIGSLFSSLVKKNQFIKKNNDLSSSNVNKNNDLSSSNVNKNNDLSSSDVNENSLLIVPFTTDVTLLNKTQLYQSEASQSLF